jgi:hypothetical protein
MAARGLLAALPRWGQLACLQQLHCGASTSCGRFLSTGAEPGKEQQAQAAQQQAEPSGSKEEPTIDFGASTRPPPAQSAPPGGAPCTALPAGRRRAARAAACTAL